MWPHSACLGRTGQAGSTWYDVAKVTWGYSGSVDLGLAFLASGVFSWASDGSGRLLSKAHTRATPARTAVVTSQESRARRIGVSWKMVNKGAGMPGWPCVILCAAKNGARRRVVPSLRSA